MKCCLCHTYRFKMSVFQEQIRSLEQKNAELRKINENLIKTLKNCTGNEDWKVKYEVLSHKYQQIQSQIDIFQKTQTKNDSQNKTSHTQISSVRNIRTTKNLDWKRNQSQLVIMPFQTPRNKIKTLSTEKMKNFLSTLSLNRNKRTDFTVKSEKTASWQGDVRSARTIEKVMVVGQKYNIQGKRSSLKQYQAQISIKQSGKRSKKCKFFQQNENCLSHKKSSRKAQALIQIMAYS